MNEGVHSRSEVVDESVLLTIDGVLDTHSYRTLRDRIVKAALDEPRAVLIDITELRVPAESALAVFTSARWQIVRWPDVPMVLVCGTDEGRNALTRNGITRYITAYSTVEEALDALGNQALPFRNRVRCELPGDGGSMGIARRLVGDWLTQCSKTDLLPVAKIVVSVLIENALRHTQCGPTGVRLEIKDDELTVAVEDASSVSANFREVPGDDELTGLKIIAAVSRGWGCSLTSNGKVVWCVIGPENGV